MQGRRRGARSSLRPHLSVRVGRIGPGATGATRTLVRVMPRARFATAH